MQGLRKRVLIADCHEEVLIVLEKLLEEAGFDTSTVWTAREAYKLIDSTSFDLVLVNEYLPDAECEEFLEVLQKEGRRMPCIVMQPSATVMTDFSRLAVRGATDIVCKYPVWRVVNIVQQYLVRGEAASTAA